MTRILSHPDPGTRKTLIQKNRDDFSALDYSGVANNPRIACFLAELFYILGEDVTSPDKGGNTLLHLMAAMGDQCAPTLEVIIRHPRGLARKCFEDFSELGLPGPLSYSSTRVRAWEAGLLFSEHPLVIFTCFYQPHSGMVIRWVADFLLLLGPLAFLIP